MFKKFNALANIANTNDWLHNGKLHYINPFLMFSLLSLIRQPPPSQLFHLSSYKFVKKVKFLFYIYIHHSCGGGSRDKGRSDNPPEAQESASDAAV